METQNTNQVELQEAKVITQELAKNNVTDAVINEYREKYLVLTINGQDDKKGYNAVKEARKICKNTRVLASKICKAGREEAIAIQKGWIAAEKEVTGRIGEIEEYLEKQEKDYEAEKERIKKEAEEKEHQRIQARVQQLIDSGCVFDGTSYNIGEISISGSDVNTATDDEFQEAIAAVIEERDRIAEEKRVEEQRIQAEREEQERQRQEEEKRMAAERVEFDRKQRDQEQREKELREKEEAIAREKENLLREKVRSRNKQLSELGLKYNTDQWYLEDLIVSEREILDATDQDWSVLITDLTARIKPIKEAYERQQREKAAEEARQKEERKKEEERKRAEAEAAEAKRIEALKPDKEKLVAYANALLAVQAPDLSTDAASEVMASAYRTLQNVHHFITSKTSSL